MIPIIVPDQQDGIAASPVNIWLADYIQQQYSGYRAIYVGGDWCAPCKALKPLVDKLLTQYPTIQGYEIKLDQNTDLLTTPPNLPPLIQSLPTLLLVHKGELLGKLSGLVETNTIIALFNKGLVGEAADITKEKSGILAAAEISALLKSKPFNCAHDLFESLESNIKYQPVLQQAKSLIDLVQYCSINLTDLTQQEFHEVYREVIKLNLTLALDILFLLLNLSHKEETRALYIRTLNCLTDKALAAQYRKKLHSIRR